VAQIVRLPPERAREAGAILGRSHADYPSFSHLFPERPRRARALQAMFTGVARDAARLGSPYAAVTDDDATLGATIWLAPGRFPWSAWRQLVHGRYDVDRFHGRGYNEMGTTTTRFEMVVLNEMSRYHLAIEALRRSRRRPAGSEALEDECREMLARHHRYVREHLEDMPEIRDWTWSG
jgi:XFP C-terminal domain